MITLEAHQVERISKKGSILAQCEWFRKTYGCTMEVRGKYFLEFKTEKEESFFLLKYSNEINTPKILDWPEMLELRSVIYSWTLEDEQEDWDIDNQP